MLGVLAALIAGALLLGAFGQALGAKSKHQRAADLAAMSGAVTMRQLYPGLFASPTLEDGTPNPAYLPLAAYLDRVRAVALRVARANGIDAEARDVTFPDASFAPTRVTVAVRGRGRVLLTHGSRGRQEIPIQARATAGIAVPTDVPWGMPATASGGGYDGPLAYRMGEPMRPDVAVAFDALAAAARSEAGLHLSIASAFRSDAEQARLFAANPNPKWVAPPGTSLHRYGTELDLGPPAAYGWLEANCRRFGFIKRYAWEAWHFGLGPNPRDRAHPAQYDKGSWEPPGGDHGRVVSHLPSFVPARFHDSIAAAALHWNVPMAVLAAQLYAESGFNPFAESPAGAQGIAQFMPGTAQAYGLANPFDAKRAIDAQAHLMSDLLRQFDGKIALALAAYNAGAGAVQRYGGIPLFPETRAYIARILGLLGGIAALPIMPDFEVRLEE